MPSANKTADPKKTEEHADVPITNIQKIGVLRFHAKDAGVPIADCVEIQPGQTVPVPWRIWKNYEARTDVEAMDRVHFVVGGLKKGEEMKTPTAQAQALALQLKEIEKREADLALYEARLEESRRELDAKQEAMTKGH